MTPTPNEQLPPIGGASPPAPPRDPAADRLARMEQELRDTRNLAQNLSSRLQSATPPPAPPQQNNSEEMRRQFYADPVAASVAIARQAAVEAQQQHGNQHMDTMIAVARSQVRSSDAELFDQYQYEIDAQVAQVDPQFRGNINVWANAFNLVKGAHIRDITDRARQQHPQAPAVHISREGGPAAPSHASAPAPRSTELSPEEKTMARKLGITEGEYSQGKVDNASQNDERVNPLGPSSWDSVVTFSSKEKRRADRLAKRR